MPVVRRRPSSRLLIVDPTGAVLLFRFRHRRGALAGQDYWATPGGGLEAGESFEQAAIRELWEETGVRVAALGPSIGEREFPLRLSDGETVLAQERFFRVQVAGRSLSRAAWSAEERAVMAEHRWWSPAELRATAETVWPENLAALVGGET